MQNNNPLLSRSNTYLNSIPFEELKPEHLEPAIKKYLESAQTDIENILSNPDEPSFENTIAALDYAGEKLSETANIISNLNAAHGTAEIQAVAEKTMPLLTAFYNEIKMNPKLFERIDFVKKHTNINRLNKEEKMLLDKTYKSFVRNGSGLPPEKQQKLKEIDQEITKTKLEFSKNLLKEIESYKLIVKDLKDLKGLPDSNLKAAQKTDENGKTYFEFNLQAPSYQPFMKFVQNRALRQKLSLAYGARAFNNNPYNNTGNVLKLAQLRQERAQLLGYPNYAAYVLEERMAQTPEKVIDFLDNLYQYAHPAAQKDIQVLQALASKDGVEKIQKWDIDFYKEKLKKQSLDLKEEDLKPYFELNNVIKGLFLIAKKLYGLQFIEQNQIQKYHPDVKTYEVRDADNQFTAILYIDFFARKEKKQGAWKTTFKSQYKKNGKNYRPHIAIIANFSKPQGDQPALLNFQEVITAFHEFGHALHSMMAQTTYPSLSGTNVYWDFVELPSQLMENWAYEKEALSLFAKHYQTGAVIPDQLIEKIKHSKNFMEAYQTNRQLSFAYLDMYWHYYFDKNKVTDVNAYEKKAFAKTDIIPQVAENNMSVSFSHIFPGGYAAGYYSYKWAEVLDADAFEVFKEKGIFDKSTAKKFQKLLASGGTRHPMQLFKAFSGHEPNIKPLLKRAGLIK